MSVFAFLFPGQGAQYPGMGRDFYEQFPEARRVFEEADDHLGRVFSQEIFGASAAELTRTKNSQVAIFIVSSAILQVLRKLFPGLVPSACAGLSLGEYTALYASGRIGFKECLDLVAARASYMEEACSVHPGSMAVVLGMEPSLIEQALAQGGLAEAVWVANLNCPGQVVIAGTREGLISGAEALKNAGAKRVLPLEVSGAFHSKLMMSAQKQLTPFIEAIHLHPTNVDLVMNVPGDYVYDEALIRKYLSEQVVSPVLWEKGVRTMVQRSYGLYVEVGPGSTLAGMNKRIGVSSPTVSVGKVSDLNQLEEVYAAFKG